MKKLLFMFLCAFVWTGACLAQGMSDQQVLQFFQSETKAGTPQSQIVTKLMQRGVKVDQIQRLRKQYDKQLSNSRLGAKADDAVSAAEGRMRKNNAATTRTWGYDNDTEIPAQTETGFIAPIQRDSINNLYHGKKVFGRDIFNNKNLNFEPNMNLATPQNYVLGPGDKVYVDIYGASQKTEERSEEHTSELQSR